MKETTWTVERAYEEFREKLPKGGKMHREIKMAC
jgi:hypothetical protein